MAVAVVVRGRALQRRHARLPNPRVRLLLRGLFVRAADCRRLPQVADAIRRNTLLGSSAIGIAAAYGLACGAKKLEDIGFEEEWNRMCANMAATRPTAPDLFRCIEVMKREVTEHRGTHPALLERLTLRADELQSSRMALDNAIAEQGDEFIKSGVRRARESCGAASAPAKRRAPQGPTPSLWSLQQSARLPRLLVRSWLGVCSSRSSPLAEQNPPTRQHRRARDGRVRRVTGRGEVREAERQAGCFYHYRGGAARHGGRTGRRVRGAEEVRER